MNVSPALAGFVKGLGTVVVFAVVGYLANSANLDGVVSTSLATILAGIFSQIETVLKARSNGEKGLFGAVKIQK